MLAYDDYLRFRAVYFPQQTESVDPAYLCRFGEYRFACEQLALVPGLRALDLACSSNIFQLFLAANGLVVTGIDLDESAGAELEPRLRHVEAQLGRRLSHTFRPANACQLPFPDESFDRVISISSVEHMFTPDEARGVHGDTLGVIEAGRVLRPGGRLVITFPMSEGGPLHEAPAGDAAYHLPYRRYTPEAVGERFLTVPGLALTAYAYIPHRVPLPFGHRNEFVEFWVSLSPQERSRWDRLSPILADRFQPLLYAEDEPDGLRWAHTGLLAFVRT